MTTKKEYHESYPGCYGEAIKSVTIHEDGTMWVGNGEYSSRVNYNPFTGEKAPFQMQNKGKHYDDGDEVFKTRWI